MSLILYHHPISQPSRAVHVALLLGKIEFVPKVIDMMTGENKSAEYTAINPAQLLPTIQEGEFVVYESHAILRYLVASRPSLKSLYPTDVHQKALVDCYLDWHLTNTRQTIVYLKDFFFNVQFGKIEAPANKAERLAALEKILDFIEKFYLGGAKQYKYIANQPQLTIADLSCHAELISLLFVNYDFTKFPAIANWIQNISQLPEVKAAYKIHNDLVLQFNQQLNDFNKKIV